MRVQDVDKSLVVVEAVLYHYVKGLLGGPDRAASVGRATSRGRSEDAHHSMNTCSTLHFYVLV